MSTMRTILVANLESALGVGPESLLSKLDLRVALTRQRGWEASVSLLSRMEGAQYLVLHQLHVFPLLSPTEQLPDSQREPLDELEM
jgi:hypothetical protein